MELNFAPAHCIVEVDRDADRRCLFATRNIEKGEPYPESFSMMEPWAFRNDDTELHEAPKSMTRSIKVSSSGLKGENTMVYPMCLTSLSECTVDNDKIEYAQIYERTRKGLACARLTRCIASLRDGNQSWSELLQSVTGTPSVTSSIARTIAAAMSST